MVTCLNQDPGHRRSVTKCLNPTSRSPTHGICIADLCSAQTLGDYPCVEPVARESARKQKVNWTSRLCYKWDLSSSVKRFKVRLMNKGSICKQYMIFYYFRVVKDEFFNMARAWDKKNIGVHDRNRNHDLPNMSYENSWRAKLFLWVPMWQASCILLGTALSNSSWAVISEWRWWILSSVIKCEGWIIQHDTSVGQRKYLSPRQESNLQTSLGMLLSILLVSE